MRRARLDPGVPPALAVPPPPTRAARGSPTAVEAAVTGALDEPDWLRFAAHALPAVFRHKTMSTPIRAWVPGCGEVAAFGVALALRHEAERRRLRGSIRVVGSHADAEAVRRARAGLVPRAAIARLPRSWGAFRHFNACDGDLLVADEALRRSLVFSVDRPGSGPPFAKLDLVFSTVPCDGAPLREALAEQIWSALRDDGVVWLASGELPVDAARFRPLPGAPNAYRRLDPRLTGPAIDALVSDALTAERMRLGQELHDTIGQHVAAASLLVHRLRKRVGPSADELLRQLETTFAAARTDVRALASGRLPVEVEGEPADALHEMLEGLRRVLPIEIAEATEGALACIDPWSAGQLLRIAQEAVRNAAASGAKRAWVSLRDERDELRLEICDDGPGLPPDATTHEGLGLRIMRDRARALGGSLTLECRDGGTAVVCTIAKR